MSDPESDGSDDGGLDRRRFLTRLGLIGIFTVPAITTFTMTGIGEAFGASPNQQGGQGNQGGKGNQRRDRDDSDDDRHGEQGGHGNQGGKGNQRCDGDDRHREHGGHGNQTSVGYRGRL